MLVVITAPHFVAGVEITEGALGNRCAPIVNYMWNWRLEQIMNYCDKKKWSYVIHE